MLVDTLDARETQSLPACAERYDKNGTKRLEKLNSVLQKSSPLKPWVLRTPSNKVRIIGYLSRFLNTNVAMITICCMIALIMHS